MDSIAKLKSPEFSGKLGQEIETLNRQIDELDTRLAALAERRTRLTDVFSFRDETAFMQEIDALRKESFSISFKTQLILDGKLAAVGLLEEVKAKRLAEIQAAKEKRVTEIRAVFQKHFPGTHPSAADALIGSDKVLHLLREEQESINAWSFSGHERDQVDVQRERAARPLQKAVSDALPCED